MGNLAIKTEGLGKRYRLGATVDFSRTFREVVIGLPKHFYNLTKSKAKRLLETIEQNYDKDTPKGTFWALKDINLEIKHGEVVGIIGRNGAGKSTLLKILSKITTPTRGTATIYGRVGSLLEVGTGFHPELTGRENIYLNGSILGMRKAEINKKFDEIVAFSEVEQFLDTPIKRYSSGMNVRLAFAVAAHLEPEILIVDEVLAVGDAAFQKKCLGKMEDVSKEGRTVLFVSHNMGAVKALCKKTILLKNGILIQIGNTNELVNNYLTENYKDRYQISWPIEKAPGIVNFKMIQAELKIDNENSSNFQESMAIDMPLKLIVNFENSSDEMYITICLVLYHNDNIVVFHFMTDKIKVNKGFIEFSFFIQQNFLNDEFYRFKIIVFDKNDKQIIRVDELLMFKMIDNNPDIAIFKKRYGMIRPNFNWEIKNQSN